MSAAVGPMRGVREGLAEPDLRLIWLPMLLVRDRDAMARASLVAVAVPPLPPRNLCGWGRGGGVVQSIVYNSVRKWA